MKIKAFYVFYLNMPSCLRLGILFLQRFWPFNFPFPICFVRQFFGKTQTHRLATIHTLQTDGRTDTTL